MLLKLPLSSLPPLRRIVLRSFSLQGEPKKTERTKIFEALLVSNICRQTFKQQL